MLELELRQQCNEPMCGSIFPELADLLEEEKYQLAIRVVGWFKKIDKYRSLADFLFVEIFPNPWRYRCSKYYEGKGPALEDYPNITEEMLSKWDSELCACAELAYDYAFERITQSWTRFRSDFLYIIE